MYVLFSFIALMNLQLLFMKHIVKLGNEIPLPVGYFIELRLTHMVWFHSKHLSIYLLGPLVHF